MERGLEWYKRDPQRFLDGVQGMGPEMIGAYAVIIDLLYSRAGRTPRDDRHLSGVLGCSMRKAKALTDRLIDIGKLQFDGQFLTNSRASEQASGRDALSEKRAEAGRRGGFSKAENTRKTRETSVKHPRDGDENGHDANENNRLGLACASSKPLADKRREDIPPVSPCKGDRTGSGFEPPTDPPDPPTKARRTAPGPETDRQCVDALAKVASPDTAADFVQHRRAMRRPMTVQSARLTARSLAGHPAPDAVLALSIANGWQGVFPDKVRAQDAPNGKREFVDAGAFGRLPVNR